MKIYRIRSVFDQKGNYVFKQVTHKDGCYEDLRKQFDVGAQLDMEWNWGCKSKKLGDLIPSSSPGMLFTQRAFNKLSALIPTAKRYQVKLDDRAEQFVFEGVVVNNYAPDSINMDHVFVMYPQRNYEIVSETFKNVWEKNGFTGMMFEYLDEVDDASFAVVAACVD